MEIINDDDVEKYAVFNMAKKLDICRPLDFSMVCNTTLQVVHNFSKSYGLNVNACYYVNCNVVTLSVAPELTCVLDYKRNESKYINWIINYLYFNINKGCTATILYHRILNQVIKIKIMANGTKILELKSSPAIYESKPYLSSCSILMMKYY